MVFSFDKMNESLIKFRYEYFSFINSMEKSVNIDTVSKA